jgi:hypothetical protein
VGATDEGVEIANSGSQVASSSVNSSWLSILRRFAYGGVGGGGGLLAAARVRCSQKLSRARRKETRTVGSRKCGAAERARCRKK